MLILSRKVGEKIILTTAAGERITLEVTEIRIGGNCVRLGFVAPATVKIDREEVADMPCNRAPREAKPIVPGAYVDRRK